MTASGRQALMAAGDPRAHKIHETLGVYLGYALAEFATVYDFRHVLLLGRVTSLTETTGRAPPPASARAAQVQPVQPNSVAIQMRLQIARPRVNPQPPRCTFRARRLLGLAACRERASSEKGPVWAAAPSSPRWHCRPRADGRTGTCRKR